MDTGYGIGALQDWLGTFYLNQDTKSMGQVQPDSGKPDDPMEAYVVELSDAAKELARTGNPYANLLQKGDSGQDAAEEDQDQSALEQQMETVQKQIERINKEIEEIQDSDLPEDEKRDKLTMKRTELAQYQAQLAQLQQDQQELMEASMTTSGSAFYNTGSLT